MASEHGDSDTFTHNLPLFTTQLVLDPENLSRGNGWIIETRGLSRWEQVEIILSRETGQAAEFQKIRHDGKKAIKALARSSQRGYPIKSVGRPADKAFSPFHT
jgi:hypothetical protein